MEPATAERPDGTLLTLIRSQTGTLWGAITRDDGLAPGGGAPKSCRALLGASSGTGAVGNAHEAIDDDDEHEPRRSGFEAAAGGL